MGVDPREDQPIELRFRLATEVPLAAHINGSSITT
jgi:hypothetical protein